MTATPNEPNNSDPGTFESLGRKLDESPEVQAAEKALRQAQVHFEQARKKYHEARADAAETLNDVKQHKVGDVVAAALELVKKHPGPGVIAAVACGWVAGRIFRR